MATILVVDDELGIRDLLFEILDDEGHNVVLAENAGQARDARARGRPDLVLLDIWMPDSDGVTLLKEWAGAGLLNMPVIMMSGHATIETAVEATRIGAFSFLEKPITLQKLLAAVELGLNKGLQGITPVPSALAPMASVSAAVHVAAPSMTVEQAMTGGSLPESGLGIGVTQHQSFDMDKPLREVRDEFERAYFEFHLSKEGGSMTRVAEKTGLERTHLYRKLKQLGIDFLRNKRAS
jgi:DNA-binding NtrC family response regulator